MSAELVVDYDPAVWVLVDPGEDDPEEWALTEAQTCLEETGTTPEPAEVAELSTVLLGAYDGTRDLAGFVLLHLPNPYGEAGPIAHVTVLDAGDGSMESLRALAGADEEGLVEPAVVDWFETPIGGAMRCTRYPTEPAGPRFLRRGSTTSMAVSYVWHLPALDTDIRLVCLSAEIEKLTAVLEDVDALARSVRVES